MGIMAADPPIATFTENRGQWPEQVAYRTRVPNGSLFVERAAFTYMLHDGGPLAHHHGTMEAGQHMPERLHAFRMAFEGARQALPEGWLKQGHYENFFLGNDPAKWGGGCAVFGLVHLNGLYPGIDLEVDGRRGLKYSFHVAAGSDPSAIIMRYTGQDRLSLRENQLVIGTSAGTVTESGLMAYQPTATGRKEVPCVFHLEGGRVTFKFPLGYDKELPLVIDPTLSFASYSGSAADNFGFTATHDNSGHLYGGSISYGTGYPVTTGVLDPTFNGGNMDITLTKFAPDGSALIWSTYLGGSGNETPHSLVVNSNDELYLLGSTGSLDFPTTTGAYGTLFNGGIPIAGNGWIGLGGGYGFGHANGTDIVVVHLASDATALLGSTYVGGSGNDGLNSMVPLMHNYGDHFRGEVALDQQEWPIICTSTQSMDMPVSPNAPQTMFGGLQDAYVFRMNPVLSTLQASYFGGSGVDSGYGVQFDSNGHIFTTGGTTSPDLPMAGSPWMGSHQGDADGYVARWSNNLGQLLSATYLGTAQYDQSYFVQVGPTDDVYVVGQTHGNYPISPNVYANPGSSQFIHKFSNDLSASLWSTRIGSGSAQDISPSAFMVSDCGQIYFSGWGGYINDYGQANGSSVNGMPLTQDSFQSTTDGNDFYLMVLEQDAAALNYATYFGGSLSAEHVDGGTSRFDKHGTIYQAVCAGCPGHDDFPTTPGAWSNTNGSLNCNLGVFKFDLIQPAAHIEVDGPDHACLPDATVSFINLSVGGSSFDWDFGDGTGTNAFEPDHAFTDAGIYTVRLVLSSDDPCLNNDTAYVQIEIIGLPDAAIDPVQPICAGGAVALHAHGGGSYQWLPAPGLAALDTADVVAYPPGNITYTVVVSNICGTDTASVDITVLAPEGVEAGDDQVVCSGQGVVLDATGGGTYQWAPTTGLDDPTSATPWATPLDTTTYHVTITTPEGCVVEDSVMVIVHHGLPVPLANDTVICPGDQVQLHVEGGDSYTWLPASGITDLHVPDPIVAPSTSTLYTVQVGNGCGTVSATVLVEVRGVTAQAWPDTVVCPGEGVMLHAAGGDQFTWSPLAADGPELVLKPAVPGQYTVIVSNAFGCSDTAFVSVSLHPPAQVTAGFEAVIDLGDTVALFASGEGTFLWSPDSTLSCSDCPTPLASPDVTTTYSVELTDANGCKATDLVTIFQRGILYVPNTFTPDQDGLNDLFLAKARELAKFQLMVFNRWGELIFTSDRLDQGWDGTFRGHPSPIGTYVWRIDYQEKHGRAHTVYGHVNLVR